MSVRHFLPNNCVKMKLQDVVSSFSLSSLLKRSYLARLRLTYVPAQRN